MNPKMSSTMAPWVLAAALAMAGAAAPWQALGQATAEEEDIVVVEADAVGEQQAEETPDTQARSTSVVTVQEREKAEHSNSFLRPSFGGIFFEDEDRVAAGFLLEANLSGSEEVIVAPVFGVVYSPLEDDATADIEDNDFILQLPAELKVAWVPRNVPRVSIGAHGGVNVIYSQAGAFGNAGDEDRFNAYANIGADLGLRVSRALEIGVRPDWTFLEDFDLFTLTVGLGVAI